MAHITEKQYWARTYEDAAVIALRKIIKRPARIGDIWQAITDNINFEYITKTPKHSLRNGIRLKLQGFDHKAGSPYAASVFTQPSKGVYGLVQWAEDIDADKGSEPASQSDDLLAENSMTPRLPEELSEKDSEFLEGASHQIRVNRYERDGRARAACIAHHGLCCCVCSFNFARVYGKMGGGFIHVHHIIPIGKIGAEYVVDPVKDLIPVCPNCHAMIHRTDPPLSIAELKRIFCENKARQG